MRPRPNPNSTRRRGQSDDKRLAQRVLRSPMTWVVALVLTTGTIAVATTASGRGNNDSPITQTAFAETRGLPLPPHSLPDAAIGLEAPSINALTMDGDRVQLQGDGVARIYGFFAHWCPHCQAEMPAVARWLNANPLPAGVEVVAISTAVDQAGSNYPPTEWFDREEWPATVLLDDVDAPLATDFGVTAFPFWVAIDADGIVVDRISGSMGEADLATLIDRLSPPS